MMSFEDFKINKQLLNALNGLEIKQPTPIQQKAIPIGLAGQDVLGIAQTGTGKTFAYLIPLLMKLKYAQGQDVRALILVPTRELVMQVEESIKELTPYLDLRFLGVYGGTGTQQQVKEIREGIDILIATPGRFLDLYRKENFIVKSIKTLILDEADRMLDMGFLPQINSILEKIPHKKRQNMLFSATMPNKVIALSESFLEFPQKVEVTPSASITTTVKQKSYAVPNFKTKLNLLIFFLEKKEHFSKVIIFVRTKSYANNISKFLSRKIDSNVGVMHANKDQNTRINALNAFKEGSINILIATDVVARGIDISDVSHVINFSPPHIIEDYVHRIGRTGRALKSGIAITFFTPAEVYYINKIEKLIKQKIPVYNLPNSIPIEVTTFDEQQQMAREIDKQKRKENPNYKGAFHEKKIKSQKTRKKKKYIK